MATRAEVLALYEEASKTFRAAKGQDEKWEALHQIRQAANRAYAVDKKAGQNGSQPTTELVGKPLQDMTIKELRKVAKDNGIAAARMSKAQILEVLGRL